MPGAGFSGRHVRIGPRSGTDLQAETFNDAAKNETVMVATMGIMSFTATPYMKRVREGCTRWADGTYTLSDDELDATLRGPMTMVVSLTGAVALVVILYLMVFKPGA